MPRPPTPVPFIQTGDPAMDRLQRFIAQALPGKQDNWVAPTLLNGWVNFGAGYRVSGYMKDSNGFVRLRGVVKSGTVGAAIFVLPSGYRPTAIENFAVWAGGAGVVEVDSSGNVKLIVGANTDCGINKIAFDTR